MNLEKEMNYGLLILVLLTFTGCSSTTSDSIEPTVSPVESKVADKVITNALVFLPNEERAEAIAISDGKLTFIGSNQEVRQLIGDSTEIIDAGDGLVLPGFIDNHNHLGEGGEVTCFPEAERTLRQQITKLAECVRDISPGKWVIGYGGNYLSEMDDLQSTPLSLLNQIFPDNPVIIMDYTSHAQFVNSLALEQAQITKQSENPAGGVYMKDASGELNGILLDNAGDKVMELAVNSEEGRFDVFVEGILYGLKQARQNGITTVGDGRTYWRRGMYEAWKQIDKDNQLTTRVSLRPWIYPDVNKQEQIDFLQSAIQNDIDKLLIVNQVKMYSDGIASYGTGRVIQPYEFTWMQNLPNGLNYIDQANMISWLETLQNLGFGAHIHAIGDLGVRETLNAIESIRNQGSTLKYNMTHLEMVDPSDLPRFALLNVDADLQLSFAAHTHSERAEHIEPFIGSQRASEIFHTPVKELHSSGANVVLSSDWTVNPISPLSAISIAVEEGSLTINEAINAYTINPAKALGLDSITGSLEIGKSADLVVLSRDLRELSPAEIKRTKTILTMLKGKVVYSTLN